MLNGFDPCHSQYEFDMNGSGIIKRSILKVGGTDVCCCPRLDDDPQNGIELTNNKFANNRKLELNKISHTKHKILIIANLIKNHFFKFIITLVIL